MRRHDGRDGGSSQPARQHRLDPYLLDRLGPADLADRRGGPLERPEPALARCRERRVVVVAEPPGPGVGQGVADPVGVRERHVDGQLVGRCGGSGQQRAHVREAERGRHRLGDTTDGLVRVGVGGQQRAARGQQGVEGAALGRRRRDAVHGREQQRVVDQQQVGTPVSGLLGNPPRRVDGAQDLADLRVRVARDQADGVPGVGRRRRVPGVQQVDDVCQGRHSPEATGTRVAYDRRPWTSS